MPKNCALCIAWSCNSVLCHIAQSCHSVLCGIAQSSDSTLCGIAGSLKKKLYLRLCAMPPSVKFKSQNVLPTQRYGAQKGVDFALSHIAEICNSVLCRIARIRDSALCRIAQSSYSAICDMRGVATPRYAACAESTYKFLCEFANICKNILTSD
jgi:hypothetical protein